MTSHFRSCARIVPEKRRSNTGTGEKQRVPSKKENGKNYRASHFVCSLFTKVKRERKMMTLMNENGETID